MNQIELGGVTLRTSRDNKCSVDGCGNESRMMVRLEGGEFGLCHRHLTILIVRVGCRVEERDGCRIEKGEKLCG